MTSTDAKVAKTGAQAKPERAKMTSPENEDSRAVRHGLPKIYAFNNGGVNGFYEAIALAEDGTCLGSHICSSDGYIPGDLGVTPGRRLDRHETYAKHYPDGYEVEFVPTDQIKTHAGLQEAVRLANEKADV